MRGLHSPADYRDLAKSPDASAGVLLALAGCEYSFVWQAVAANPRTPPDALFRLCAQRSSTWDDNRLLLLVTRHPNADQRVLTEVLGQLRARLAASESRPYAAVLALADRAEIDPGDVQALALLPGASARLRRGLQRRIAVRPAQRLNHELPNSGRVHELQVHRHLNAELAHHDGWGQRTG